MTNHIKIMYLHRHRPPNQNIWEAGIIVEQELPNGVMINFTSTLVCVYGETEDEAKEDIARIVADNAEQILAEKDRIGRLLDG